ncbi:MAG: MgtC/SapB family protein [Janthinobacterium lividum]
MGASKNGMHWFATDGQGLRQLLELGSAFLLSSVVGLEREVRRKSAGLRTYAVVGTTAALFLLISKYGFNDVLANGRVVLDPSRVAAQIVTGIGFIGAGLIFVRTDRVTGLTTAATVWLVTGIGMACGAGLLLLALAVVSMYMVVAFVFPLLIRMLPLSPSPVEEQKSAEHD